LQKLKITSKEDSFTDIKGLAFTLLMGVQDHHLICLYRPSCKYLNMGILDVVEVYHLFWQLNIKWFVDEQAKGSACIMLAYQNNPSKEHAAFNLGTCDHKNSLFYLCRRDVFHYLLFIFLCDQFRLFFFLFS